MNVRSLLAALALCAAVTCVPGLSRAQAASSDSPFMPAGGAAAPAATTTGNHELVGIIASGKQTLVGIADRTTRKSQWIPVGRSVDGVEVLSCEPKQDRAVIRVNGETKTLALRAAPPPRAPSVTVTPVAAPSVPPINPVSAVAGAPATKQAEQEREARMLVSDLLEIGIQQRKAYEEAQKKAAAQKSAPERR